MLEEPTVVHSDRNGHSTTHIVHALMQFVSALRYRKNVVLTSLAVAALLGGVYYGTATRYYEADAEIMVMGSVLSGKSVSSVADGTRQQSLMGTFEQLFTSAVVVQGALQHLRPEDRIDLAGIPEEAWPAVLKHNLSAKLGRGTNIIELSYRSKDPRTAVSVVNAVYDSYCLFLDKMHKGSGRDFLRILEDTKTTNKLDYDQISRDLDLLRSEIGEIGISAESNVLHPVQNSVVYFSNELDQVQKERMQLEASLAAIRSAVDNGQDLQQSASAVEDVVGAELLRTRLGLNRNDASYQTNVQIELTRAQAELATMREDLGPAHPDVISKIGLIQMYQGSLADFKRELDNRLAELQDTELGPILLDIVQGELNEIWRLETSLQATYNRARAEAVQLNKRRGKLLMLKSEKDQLLTLNGELVNKIADVELKDDGQEIRTEVIQEPIEPGGPVSPRLRQVILMVLFGGLTVGMGLVYMMDILDDRFRSVEEMQTQLNTPILAMVQRLSKTGTVGPDALQVHADPNATECEAFRTLRTALALSEGQVRQIVISSSEPGDGKTTILANLAVSYAQSGKKTLLIDADLRRPGLTALMGMRGIEGLSSIIRGQDNVIQMAGAHIRPSGIEGLDVLASGPRPTNPAELLTNPRFAELLAGVEAVYDQILIDSPPALATSDTIVIGRLVDGVVMVVQPEKNRRRTVMRAVESFASLKIPLLGVVVNRVGSENDRGYYGYGYSYAPGYGMEEELSEETTRSEVDGSEVDDWDLDGEQPAPNRITPTRVA